MLDTPGGLDASHNLIETDASGTRDDLYVTGNAWDMDLGHFQAMLAGIKNGALQLENAFDFAMTRFTQSVQTNPLFFYGPAVGLLVRNGGFLLPYRLFSNFSEEYAPDGKCSKSNTYEEWQDNRIRY